MNRGHPMPFFRVATEGATTDGRIISRDWITQMAGNYDPKKYGARVWMEHMRGMFHDGPFPALGDIKALKAEEVEDGKLGLFADIDPTDKLKQINGERQKVYTSIEVDPDFAGSGEAYFVGLAVTDSPASLGTEMLQFSAKQGSASPLAARKQRPENLFTAAVEVELDFSDALPEPDKGPSLTERITALFKKHDAKSTARTQAGFDAFSKDLEQTFELFVKRHEALESELEARPSTDAFNELKTAHDDLKRRFDELHTQLDNAPSPQHHRSRATGNDGSIVTDC
ncbi:GPO family capsid scaffolding protein [Halomonas sp. MMSF_3323]|uniref:GPO family capsid scaffolding protein n=1 Tax=Halomonas sp. MMSF_3323 TaxID=3046701 RepID=UPI00273D3E63|nr:GPO family capsid scaffolding protein [Halomonas sp. MMSF_3323]